jgi:hypothetical protein
VNRPYRDKYLEALFSEAYGIKCIIESQNFIDADYNWEKVIRTFITKNKYTIIEYYNEGNDNSTDYVIVKINNEPPVKLKTYYEAEIAIVKSMREE